MLLSMRLKTVTKTPKAPKKANGKNNFEAHMIAFLHVCGGFSLIKMVFNMFSLFSAFM